MTKRKISTANEVRTTLAKPLNETPYVPQGKYKKVSSKTNVTARFWLWIIAIIVVLIILYNQGKQPIVDTNNPINSSISSDSDKITLDEEIAVIMVVKPYVTNHLKAPATAQFPDDTDLYPQVKKTANGYSITSYVDSQNGFGALIRTYYACTVGTVGNSLGVTNLEFQEN